MMWLVLPHWSIKGVLLRGDWLGLKGNLSQSPFSCRRIWPPLSKAFCLSLTFEPSRQTCVHHYACWIVSWRHKRTTHRTSLLRLLLGKRGFSCAWMRGLVCISKLGRLAKLLSLFRHSLWNWRKRPNRLQKKRSLLGVKRIGECKEL